MKNILSLILAVFLSAGAMSASALQLTYPMDFVTFDYPGLEEPKGDGHLVIILPDAIFDTLEEPYTKQVLLDVVPPIVKRYQDLISSLAGAIRDDLNKIKGKMDDKQKKNLETTLKNLNKSYLDSITRASTEAENAVWDKWEELQNQHKELKKFKLNVSLTIAKGVFQVAKGIIGAAVSLGTDPTAYIGIIQGIITIYDGVSDAFKTEESARKDLEKAIKKGKEALTKFAKDKADKKTIMGFVSKWLAQGEGEDLDKKILVHIAKLIDVRLNAQALAKNLEETLYAEKPDPKNAELTKQYEATVNQQVTATAKLGEVVSTGEKLEQEAKGLVKLIENSTKSSDIPPENILQALDKVEQLASQYDAAAKSATSAVNSGKDALQGFIGVLQSAVKAAK